MVISILLLNNLINLFKIKERYKMENGKTKVKDFIYKNIDTATPLNVGSIFYHINNEHPYIILGTCKIQENSTWVNAILYANLDAYKEAVNKYKVEKFVRSEDEFRLKFKMLKI